MEDFNIRNSDWDSFYPFHLTHSNSLIEVADSFDLKLLSSTHQISTYYFDNLNNVNSIIDLIFLRLNSIEIDNYSILPKSQHPSDYAPLTVDIFIMEEFIQEKQHTIIRNSKEKKFVSKLMNTIENIDTSSIPDKKTFEAAVQEYTRISGSI